MDAVAAQSSFYPTVPDIDIPIIGLRGQGDALNGIIYKPKPPFIVENYASNHADMAIFQVIYKAKLFVSFPSAFFLIIIY